MGPVRIIDLCVRFFLLLFLVPFLAPYCTAVAPCSDPCQSSPNSVNVARTTSLIQKLRSLGRLFFYPVYWFAIASSTGMICTFGWFSSVGLPSTSICRRILMDGNKVTPLVVCGFSGDDKKRTLISLCTGGLVYAPFALCSSRCHQIWG